MRSGALDGGIVELLGIQELKLERRDELGEDHLPPEREYSSARLIRPNAGDQVLARRALLVLNLPDRQRERELFPSIVKWDGDMNHRYAITELSIIDATDAHHIGVEQIHPDSENPLG